MTGAGGVLLVSCYELGHQPLGLAAPLAALRRAGYEPATADIAVETLPAEAVQAAGFVGIAVPMHTAMRLGLRVARQIREINPRAHICFYGLYASLNEEFLLADVADSCIGGEYAPPLVDLVRRLSTGSAGPTDGVSESNHAAGPRLDGRGFGRLDRQSLPALGEYAHLMVDGQALRVGYVEATHGCAHLCRHCPITPVYQGRFVVVPREHVLEDIEQQIEAGAQHLTFGDPDFLNGPTHSLRICRELHRRHPDVTFDCTTKIEHILEQRALFPELAELGCAFVVSAVESFNDLTLERLGKDHTREDVFAALGILRAAGLPMRPTLIPFNPWDQLDDYLELLAIVEERELIDHIDPVHYSIRLLVPPGSALLAEPDTQRWLGELVPEAFAYRWEHPDPRMDRLQSQVAALAEHAEAKGEDAFDTFVAIRTVAHAAAEKIPPATRPRRKTAPPPRLTESWFC